MYVYAFPKGLSMLKQLLCDSFVPYAVWFGICIAGGGLNGPAGHKFFSHGVKCELFHNKMADEST